MNTSCKDIAIQKIVEMPKEQVAKVLIFMAGMEAEYAIDNQIQNIKQSHHMLKNCPV